MTNKLILYTTPDGEIKVNAVLQNETICLTQGNMSELFGIQRLAITRHLKNIFGSGELDEKVVSSIWEHTTFLSRSGYNTSVSKMKTVQEKAFVSAVNLSSCLNLQSCSGRSITCQKFL